MRFLRSSVISVVVVAFLFSGIQVFAEYLKPPRQVASILERSPLPEVTVSPDQQHLLLIYREGMPGIEQLSRPYLALAGRRFIPGNLGPVVGRNGWIAGMKLLSIRDGRSLEIRIPAAVNPGFPRFSPDSRWVSFLDIQEDGISIWIAEAASGVARRFSGPEISLVTGSYLWMPDSSGIICRMKPEGTYEPPESSGPPDGPVIQECGGEEAKARTYQDLLKTPHDIALFDYYFNSQLMMITLEGKAARIGPPSIFNNVSISPDGNYLAVTRVVKPYSYLVPWYYFARELEIWRIEGSRVATIASLDRSEDIPIGGVPSGPRSLSWRDDQPASLVWAEALDGGDPKAEVPNRDRLMNWSAPFRGKPRELLKLQMRFRGVQWGSAGREFVFTEDRIRQWTRTWIVTIRGGEVVEKELLWDRDRGDAYGDPGTLVAHHDSRGQLLVEEHRGKVLLKGRGSSPRGDFPFLDQLDLETGKTRRIFQNTGDAYENVVEVLDPLGKEIVVRRETVESPPSYFLVNTRSGERSLLTAFQDPSPELRGVRKEIIRYIRKDGIELSGTLYLPPGWKKGERLPMIMWAYPREYNDPRIAAQVRGSSHRFPIVRGASHLFFLLEGYAVLDGPAMPVVGEQGNDTFVEQLVMNAKAAVDKVVSIGVADPERIVIGGHSYGAFMTANLLAHSDFFAAGIARSGAYNRTLTPFGFQNERRTFWEAPEVYFAMSPFMHADQVDEPILMIHGARDNNSGTFPIQSRRMFHALKGLGSTARLVVLPAESHGYAARESVLHTVYEMLDWADRFVKNKEGIR